MTNQKKQKMVAPDLIRILACFSVISIHFFLNSGFYELPIDSPEMILMLAARLLFTICVPLFMILSGYLMINKPLSKTHYAKGMKIVWIYVLSSIACLIYSLYICNRVGTTLSTPSDKAVENAIWGILNYKTASYSWYVEMYFGLYLLVPFLNVMYNNLPSRNWKRVLILSLITMTVLPTIINANDFRTDGWWDNPTLSTSFQKVIPAWWCGVYPLTYYFIGAYLREYGASLSKLWLRILIVASIGIAVLYNLWRAQGEKFAWGSWNDWASPFSLLTATLIFALLISKDYSRLPSYIIKPIGYLSSVTLGIYLVSFIFDTEAYRILKREIPVIEDRFITYFLIVPLIFLCSFALSALLDLIYRLLCLLYRKVRGFFTPSERSKAEPLPCEAAEAEPLIPSESLPAEAPEAEASPADDEG